MRCPILAPLILLAVASVLPARDLLAQTDQQRSATPARDLSGVWSFLPGDPGLSPVGSLTGGRRARACRARSAGCFSLDGYTHETQCVVYDGPDTLYRDHEICFNSNEDTLTIVDATDKLEQVQVSRTGYGGSAYTHQGLSGHSS